MKRFLALTCVFLALPSWTFAGDKLPKPLVSGLKNPYGVAVGSDKRIYVTESVEPDKEGEGRIVVIEKDNAVPFATGLNDPSAIVAWQNWLFVADKDRIWRIDRKGKASLFAGPDAFPEGAHHIVGICVDEQGTLYACGGLAEKGAVFRITPKGKVTLVSTLRTVATGVVMDGLSFVVSTNAFGFVAWVNVSTGEKARYRDIGDDARLWGVTWDNHGRLYVSDGDGGRIHVIPPSDQKRVELIRGFKSPEQLALDPTGRFILVVDRKAGTLTAVRAQVPGQEVDDSPMPLETVPAFPDLKWTGWKGVRDDGRVFQLRPLLLTHAGDGTDRVFVGIQQGIIHVFPNDQKADKTKIFLDIKERVRYNDNENEEGFLGLAFHPDYKKNGEFFVFYTLKNPKLTNVVSRFRVKKDNPDEADPDSEEEILRITRPFWNHDGGTICFGPDGYLYIALGDGGAANDPHKNGQKLSTLLAKVLRIDVDRKEDGKNYAIPKDNPFIDHKDARPEIWAYGLRNVWRMAFDSKTGKLWASDVGQNLYEEIDIIVKGGNYGWSLREGLHPFSANGVGPRKDLIEPIWEYHHDVGKSLTGGAVYRGKRLPELDGYYVYGDFVTGNIWALRYDEDKARVVANRPIRDLKLPILSFGEDQEGEIYLLTTTATGQGIYRFDRAAKKR